MRLCVAMPCFFKGDFCEGIKTIASIGFDAAETYAWKSLDIERVCDTLQETGVELLSMCTTSFDLTDPLKRGEWVAGIEESCIAANKLGVKKLITQVGADTGKERSLQHRSIVEGLREGAPVLEEYGVTVMIEPLNALYNHPGYYLTAAGEAFEIIREVNSTNVKVVYDIYHQQVTEGNIINNVTNNIECIAHLHGAGHPGRHELFFGESNYPYIIKAIEQAGYTGALGLEYSPLLDPIESLKLTKRNI